MLSLKTYLKITKIIFFFVGLMHGLRLILGWQIIIRGWMVPMWCSVVGFIVAWYITYSAWKLLGKTKKK